MYISHVIRIRTKRQGLFCLDNLQSCHNGWASNILIEWWMLAGASTTQNRLLRTGRISATPKIIKFIWNKFSPKNQGENKICNSSWDHAMHTEICDKIENMLLYATQGKLNTTKLCSLPNWRKLWGSYLSTSKSNPVCRAAVLTVCTSVRCGWCTLAITNAQGGINYFASK